MCVNVAFVLDTRIFHIRRQVPVFPESEVVQDAHVEGSAVGTGAPSCFPAAVG